MVVGAEAFVGSRGSLCDGDGSPEVGTAVGIVGGDRLAAGCAADKLNRLLDESQFDEAVADKGYHANETLADCRAWGSFGLRTYIPEPNSKSERRWSDKPPAFKEAVYANRRRLQGDRNKKLQRKRSELVERSFAHICETAGARRSWLRGLEPVNKRYKMVAAARNLGLVMRKLFGIGKPRCL